MIGPISGLVGSWMDSKTEEQRGKTAVAKAKAEGSSRYGFSSDIDCRVGKADGRAAKFISRMNGSLVFLAYPSFSHFVANGAEQSCAEGFAALEMMPDYYQYTLGVIVAASFGVRSATKFFGKK